MTREEAIKRLYELQFYSCLKSDESVSMAKYWDKTVTAIDMAIAALREQEGKDTNVPTKWIGVDEKLPEKEKSVLILCKNKAVFTGYKFTDYCGDSRWRIHTALNSTKLLNKGRVTHWMPLPEPPEVEG